MDCFVAVGCDLTGGVFARWFACVTGVVRMFCNVLLGFAVKVGLYLLVFCFVCWFA